MASKTGQITVKKSVVERLDEMRFRDPRGIRSYSDVIEDLIQSIPSANQG